MLRQVLLIIVMFFSVGVYAQTGIGTTTPHTSAKLDVSATNKGFLPPRVTLTSTTDASTIPSPATGLLVYNTGNNAGLRSGYYYWNGTDWTTIATPISAETVDYVSTLLTNDLTVNTNDVIKFNSIYAGNIPYNASTGKFTLTAGKTYRLNGSVSLSNGNANAAEVSVGWKNAAGELLGNKAEVISASYTTNIGGNGIVEIVYTPSINTTVSLEVIYASNNAILWNRFTYANIQQIGSSAIINPWVLSGTNTYNTTGDVGIGTNSSNTSAILDVNSTSKGILIPRMTASQKNVISSPTTGLLIFQTDNPSDFYYYNGNSWIGLREPNWTSAGTIQSVGWNATSTAPTIGTTTVNDYSYKQLGPKTWKCQLTFSAGSNSIGANNGSGDYIFTLPNGLQFNTSLPGQAAVIDNIGTSSWIWPSFWLSNSSGSITNLGQGGLLYVVPFSNTQFRLIHVGIAGVGFVIPYASGYYGVGSNISWRVTFTFQSN